MFKKFGLLKLGGCVLALGLLNAVINQDDEKEVQVVKEVEEVKNEVNYNSLEIKDIEKVVLSVVKEKTNKNKDRILDITVSEENKVRIDLNADSSINAYTSIKKSNELFNKLKKFTAAEQINIIWHDTSIDELGNKKEIEIVEIGLNKELLNKINFENYNVLNYEKHANNYYVHYSWSIK